MANSARISEIERPGVLNRAQIKRLIANGTIKGWSAERDNHIGASSFDLHLAGRYWKLPAGFKCNRNRSIKLLIQAAQAALRTNDHLDEWIEEGVIQKEGKKLIPGDIYLFELQEVVNLTSDLRAQASGRSSIGRLDVLTRLLVDNEERYDCISGEGSRNLYVEITPLSFPIRLFSGDRVYQLRIAKGEFNRIEIQEDILKLYSVMMKGRDRKSPVSGPDQLCLRLDLTPTQIRGLDDKVIAFKAKKEDIKNLDPLCLNEKDAYCPESYWDCITEKHNDVRIIDGNYALKVRQGDFYILRSQERFTLPDDIAAYGIAMTEEVGELRIHHAGFVHSGFGSVREEGTPLIFEVRGHDLGMFLMDGDLMAKLRYYPMSKPDKEESDFDFQELSLPKIFKDFGHANRNP